VAVHWVVTLEPGSVHPKHCDDHGDDAGPHEARLEHRPQPERDGAGKVKPVDGETQEWGESHWTYCASVLQTGD
jgi:hypothetical protein